MKMEHITINAVNLDETIAFYQDILGLEIKDDFRKSSGMPIVFLSSGEGASLIEIIENPENAYSGTGLSIGFHVDDVIEAHDRMNEKGFNPSEVISPNDKVKFFFIQDPNGVNIQLI